MSRSVITNYEKKERQLRVDAVPMLPKFLEKLYEIVDKHGGLTDSEKKLVKGFLKKNQNSIVSNVEPKEISLMILPGGLNYDKRSVLSKVLHPVFLEFRLKVKGDVE